MPDHGGWLAFVPRFDPCTRCASPAAGWLKCSACDFTFDIAAQRRRRRAMVGTSATVWRLTVRMMTAARRTRGRIRVSFVRIGVAHA
jgi:hypothetical protein